MLINLIRKKVMNLSDKKKSLNYRRGLKGLSKRDFPSSEEFSPYGTTFYSEVRGWVKDRSKKL